MQQFFSDFWAALDWPNIIVSAIVAILLGYLATKIYPMWQKSRDTSRIILSNRKKSAIKRDMRVVLRMHADPNYMSLWCTERIIVIVSFLSMIVVFVVLFALYVIVGMGKRESVELAWSPYAIMVIMVAPLTLMFLELLNFARVANYYRKFDEFLKRAHEILTVDEIKAIEGSDD